MPLYSGIAAALFTLLKGPGGDAITWKTEEQGQFWSKYFHSGSSATNFTQLANLLDLGKFKPYSASQNKSRLFFSSAECLMKPL